MLQAYAFLIIKVWSPHTSSPLCHKLSFSCFVRIIYMLKIQIHYDSQVTTYTYINKNDNNYQHTNQILNIMFTKYFFTLQNTFLQSYNWTKLRNVATSVKIMCKMLINPVKTLLTTLKCSNQTAVLQTNKNAITQLTYYNQIT
jgi:hypothetical protein